MVKKRLILILTILVIALLAAAPAAAAPRLYQVKGGGTIDFEGWGKETYAISARQIDAEGNARGQVQLTWHYPEYPGGPDPWIMHADVVYLAVDPDTGNAWIGAVITHSNYWYYEGVEFFLPVYDGGAGNAPDMIGYTYLGYPAIYALYKIDGLTMFEFIHGNILLK